MVHVFAADRHIEMRTRDAFEILHHSGRASGYQQLPAGKTDHPFSLTVIRIEESCDWDTSGDPIIN